MTFMSYIKSYFLPLVSVHLYISAGADPGFSLGGGGGAQKIEFALLCYLSLIFS